MFEHVEDRLVLKPGAKHLITYAPFLDLFVGPGEELFAKCIIQGCDSEASKEGKGIRLTYPKLNMNNVIDHFMRSHGGVFVTALDYKQRAGAIAAKAPAASDARKRARGSGRGEDGGGGRGEEGAEALVATAKEEKTVIIQRAARWLVQDGLPWSLAHRGRARQARRCRQWRCRLGPGLFPYLHRPRG